MRKVRYLHRHMCGIPQSANTTRDSCAIPLTTSTKELLDTRYKYRMIWIGERPPGLMYLVLTALVFWSRVLVPGRQLRPELRWPEAPFWYRDLLFGIEILRSAFCCWTSRSSSSWDQPVRAFLGLAICKLEVRAGLNTEKKINKSRYQLKEVTPP